MLTEKYKNYIDRCFRPISNEPDAVLKMSAMYCVAQWINHDMGDREISLANVVSIFDSEGMRSKLRLLYLDRYPIREHAGELYGLCDLIRKCNFIGHRAKLFYRLYLPCVVTDTSIFAESLLSAENGPVSCTMIYLMMLFAAGDQTDGIGLLAPDVYARWRDTLDYLGVDYDEFERYWFAVHYLDAECRIRKRQKIEEAIRTYSKFKAPKTMLLSQYAQALHFTPQELRRANPWEYAQKKLKTTIQESGMSADEELFNAAAYQISRESPTDVIQTIFYKGRDDAPMEAALARSELKRLMIGSEHILIVNPSPVFLREVDNLNPGHKQITFAVNDNVVAYLYGQQYPGYQFITIDSLGQEQETCDLVVILARDHEMKPLWNGLQHCKDGASILLLVPQTALTESDKLLLRTLKENEIHPAWILDVPVALTKSAPRKKMLIYARSGKVYSGKNVDLLQAVTDKGNHYLSFVREQYSVAPELLMQGLTLVQLRSAVKKAGGEAAVKAARDSQIYDFSKEIKICYNIIKVDGKPERARAYYRNIHRPESEINRTKGKRPNDIKTERGLRAKTEAEILERMERVALYEEYYELIVADILDYYRMDLSCLTLKTMWYCCRDELLSRISYDEEIAIKLFCGADQSLSNLVLEDSTPEEIAAAMQASYGQEEVGKKVWLQFNLICQAAVEEGILEKNPLASFVQVVKEESRNRIYLLNAALKKSHFTAEEETRMVSFLREDTPVARRKGASVPRYVLESKWLAGAFSLFTGLPVREICPLTWGDLNRIDGAEGMQAYITKHLNHADAVISNVHYGNRCHFRKIALDMTLSRMLLERKRYLIEQCGYTEDSLADLPIMLEKEPSGRGRKKHRMITKATVRKVNRRLLDEAQIPQDLISLMDGEARFDVDLNAQRNDLFAANFRHKAYHICGYTAGELCHHAGNKAPDTFSRHYCDYGNDILQYQMVRKLNRWTYVYDPQNNANMPSRCVMDQQEQEYSTGCYADGLAHAELTLHPGKGSAGKIRVEISCEHGLEGMAVALGKEEGSE